MPDETDDIRAMLLRIEQGQANLNHEINRLRADLALMGSRQNSKITDTKKKSNVSPNLYKSLGSGYYG